MAGLRVPTDHHQRQPLTQAQFLMVSHYVEFFASEVCSKLQHNWRSLCCANLAVTYLRAHFGQISLCTGLASDWRAPENQSLNIIVAGDNTPLYRRATRVQCAWNMIRRVASGFDCRSISLPKTGCEVRA